MFLHKIKIAEHFETSKSIICNFHFALVFQKQFSIFVEMISNTVTTMHRVIHYNVELFIYSAMVYLI
jgi:hypothetical protein